jgi:light-regulated signal transduction histidine kinase (bacteriophytochrome)
MSLPNNPEPDIHHLQERVSAIETEFNDFIYTVSHDLGAPLRAVVNFSKLLDEKHIEMLDETARCYMAFVTEGGEKAQAMLTGLVNYSRLNTLAKPLISLETTAVIARCRKALKDKMAACKGSVLIHGTLPTVMADADQLFQLFCALVDNALTYQPPGNKPRVQISALDTGNEWKFFVADNGIGIPPENAERVFKIFKRLHTDAEYPGVGMGLALAGKIVSRHGGKIGIMPSDGRGTVCWFTLPKSFPEAASTHSMKKAYG